jgi:hypothetical protein
MGQRDMPDGYLEEDRRHLCRVLNHKCIGKALLQQSMACVGRKLDKERSERNQASYKPR